MHYPLSRKEGVSTEIKTKGRNFAMKKLRLGIIGAGGQRCCFHGGCVFMGVRNVEIAALCDNRADRLAHAEKMYAEHAGFKGELYADYTEMLAKAGLDAVYIAGPNYLHREMAVAALDAKLHVLCEKPFALSLKDADEIIAAAERNDRILGLGMQMHYRERYLKIGELIESGEIGRVTQCWCMEHRPTFIAMKDWVWDPALSGGAIVEKNCHHYDVMDIWVKSDPTLVYATGNIMRHFTPHGFRSGIVDNAWILNDYANGAKAMVGINFCADSRHYREFGIIGTRGRIDFSSEDGEIVHIRKNSGETADLEINTTVRGDIFQDFADSVLDCHAPLVTAQMGRRSMLVPLAAEISMREKRAVHVSELA